MKTTHNTPMMMFTYLLIILTAGLSSLKVSAQQSKVNPTDLIGAEEKITAFAETDRFYWIGTENGLYQVKKKTGKVCHLTEQNSELPANKVTAICSRSNGEVFVGTTNGILRYDRFAFMVVNTENAKLPANSITALHCDEQDFIWIGTSSNSLSLIRFVSMNNYKIFSTSDSIDHIVAFEKSNPHGVTLVMAGGSRMIFANGHLQKTADAETAEFSAR